MKSILNFRHNIEKYGFKCLEFGNAHPCLGVLTFQGFAMLASYVLGPEESFTFVHPMTTFCLPRLPPSLRLLRERPKTPCLGLLLRRADRTKGTINI
jgi:hypothetical protein